jgi:hypothetical protein
MRRIAAGPCFKVSGWRRRSEGLPGSITSIVLENGWPVWICCIIINFIVVIFIATGALVKQVC